MATIDLVDCDGVKVTPTFYLLKDRIKTFEVRDNDVWVTSYPKAGTTWCQEMIWLIENNLDYESATKTDLAHRFPFFELSTSSSEVAKFIKLHNIPTSIVSSQSSEKLPDLETVENMGGQRLIKTHLPWDFLPKQITDGVKSPKIIHVMRNPKQVAVSYYHHSAKVFPVFLGTLDEFVDMYIKGELLRGDYFRTVLSYWNERHRSNLLIITYEEMHSDLPTVIKRVCDFLDKSYSEEEITKLARHLSFDAMKKNDAVNWQKIIRNDDIQFIRKGTIDGYKEELTADMTDKLDRWINENIKGTGLPYENC